MPWPSQVFLSQWQKQGTIFHPKIHPLVRAAKLYFTKLSFCVGFYDQPHPRHPRVHSTNALGAVSSVCPVGFVLPLLPCCFTIELFKKKEGFLGSVSCYFSSNLPSSDNTRLHSDSQSNLAGYSVASTLAVAVWEDADFFWLKIALLRTCLLWPFPASSDLK